MTGTGAPAKPLPKITLDGEQFFRFLDGGELMLRSCADCGLIFHYPRIVCVRCLSRNLGWSPASGFGTVHASTAIYRPADEAYRARLPLILALVDLKEGPRLMSNIIDCDPGPVVPGLEVELVIERRAPGIGMPLFRPVSGEGKPR